MPSATPPSPQEIHRKLNAHPSTRRKSTQQSLSSASYTQSPPHPGTISGTESDSDSYIPAPPSSAIPLPNAQTTTPSSAIPISGSPPSSHQQQHVPGTSPGSILSSSYHTTTSVHPPLSSIAERSPGSENEEEGEGEDSEEEEEEGGWRNARNAGQNPSVQQAEGDVRKDPSVGGNAIGIGIGGVEGLIAQNDETVLKNGYLWKKGERRKTWKKRWFVLRPTHLAFYKSDAEYKLLRLLDLSDVHSCVPVSLKRHDHAFGLICPKRTYYLQASNRDEVGGWVRAIEDARLKRSGLNIEEHIPPTPTGSVPNPSATTVGASASPPSPLAAAGARAPSVSPPTTYSTPNPNQPSQVISSSDSDDPASHTQTYLTIPETSTVSGAGGVGGQRPVVAPPPTKLVFSVPPAPPSPLSTSPGAGLNKDPASPSKVILTGYLMKLGSKRRTWRKRWFVLAPDRLFYSSSHMDTKPHRVFPFSDILDAMDYDLPSTSRHGHGLAHGYGYGQPLTSSVAGSSNPLSNSPQPSASLSTSLPISSSSPPAPGLSLTTTPTTPGGQPHVAESHTTGVKDADRQGRVGGGGTYTFKIVMTKRSLVLCAPSEEDEVRWLGAIRAVVARRQVGLGLAGQQQQQQPQGHQHQQGQGQGQSDAAQGMPAAVTGEKTSGEKGSSGGLKGKVRRLSAGAVVLGAGGGGKIAPGTLPGGGAASAVSASTTPAAAMSSGAMGSAEESAR